MAVYVYNFVVYWSRSYHHNYFTIVHINTQSETYCRPETCMKTNFEKYKVLQPHFCRKNPVLTFSKGSNHNLTALTQNSWFEKRITAL